jgi:DNA topoisomerase-2
MPPKLTRTRSAPASSRATPKVSARSGKAKAAPKKKLVPISEIAEEDMVIKGEVKKTYTKLDPISHVLKRCEPYIGSKVMKTTEEFVADEECLISKRSVVSSKAVYGVFREAISNAMDNIINSKISGIQCSKLEIVVDKLTGFTSVLNDGDFVPVEINPDHGGYNHSMVFGEMLTGSNYDDTISRATSGKNGMGIKILNIFSKQFTVEGCDPVNGKILTQTWTSNMRRTDGPKIKNTKLKKGYTKVSWVLDFEEFGLEGYTDDLIDMYRKYVVDASMLSGVRTRFNELVIPKPTLKFYTSLYTPTYKQQLFIQTEDCKVIITPSEEFTVISFVNGLYTKHGGSHVNPWIEALFRPILNKINNKRKSNITLRDIKGFFRIFVVANVANPDFNNQEKEILEAPNVTAVISPSQIKHVCRWDFMDGINKLIDFKEVGSLKKTEGSRRAKVDGLDQANKSGTKRSSECSLLLCEGLSAKTYAVAGLDQGVYGKQGRDWFGILPLRGKFLNVKKVPTKTIIKNKIVISLVQSLGLKYNTDYTNEENYKSLRYGRVICLCDSDCDGIHIEGLIINFFNTMFPSLLNREEPFIISMKTPIVRVFGNNKDTLFFDENRFTEFSLTAKFSKKPKYYKGLGTTKAEDVPDTFGKKMVNYKMDENSKEGLSRRFEKSSDFRKKEILDHNPSQVTFSLDDQGEVYDMPISQFLDCELIKYSYNNCKTKLPNIIDGFKESQRKILYAMKKRNLGFDSTSLKVAQLGGYVAEHTNYHHGEQNLYNTITNMATDYVGSNNIPLFYRDGMFGTRLENGKDAASARYIYTKMDYMTQFIFMKEDDDLVERIVDDGDIVEPKHYIPIIPMILVNGACGIATGFSSSFPCYNPVDIVDRVRSWIRNKEDPDNATEIEDLTPWYRKFNGSIEKLSDSKFITKGLVEKSEKSYSVTELPIGMSTESFKEYCETLLEKKIAKSFNNYSSPTVVNFEVFPANKEQDITSHLSPSSNLSTANLVAIDHTMKISNYSIIDILKEFCKVRYSYYTVRKQVMIDKITNNIQNKENQIRFVNEVSAEIINLKTKKSLLVEVLKTSGYKLDEQTFNYLLNMKISSFTDEKLEKMNRDLVRLKDQLEIVVNTKESAMWEHDLSTFMTEYTKWNSSDVSSINETGKGRGGRGSRCGRGSRGGRGGKK